MIIFPAIDLLGGQCVRLKQGAENTAKVYNDEPADQAELWQRSGAAYLHVVNLDGAFGRAAANAEAIRHIRARIDIPMQLGGGIRTFDDAKSWLDAGVTRVIFGTAALMHPDEVARTLDAFGAERVVIGIDGRDNKVAIQGWEEQTETAIPDLALQMKNLGAGRIIYTDVHRDGEGVGPNLFNTDDLAKKTGMKIIASGGFSTLEHFENLQALENPNIEGAIVGTALYEKQLDLRDLIDRFQQT